MPDSSNTPGNTPGNTPNQASAQATEPRSMIPAPRRRRRLLRPFLLLLGPVVVLLGAAYLYETGGRSVDTDNAYVKSSKTSISADISGRVTSVLVHENDIVKAGEPLFTIDEEPLKIALAKAEAKMQNVGYDIDALRASYHQRQEELKMAQSNQEYADREYKRRKNLIDSKVISATEFDDARNKLDVANRQIDSIQQDLDRILAQLGGSPDIPVEQHPQYMEAAAEVDQAKLDLRHAVVPAPDTGIVSRIDALQVGDYVNEGQPVFSLVSTEHLWVEANLKETDLTNVKPGQRATVTIDSYPGETWTGTVASIGAATGSEFSVLPPQNASGNWVKVVQRLPVRVVLDSNQSQSRLRAGMSAIVDIDTNTRRSFAGLFGGIMAWADSEVGTEPKK